MFVRVFLHIFSRTICTERCRALMCVARCVTVRVAEHVAVRVAVCVVVCVAVFGLVCINVFVCTRSHTHAFSCHINLAATHTATHTATHVLTHMHSRVISI